MVTRYRDRCHSPGTPTSKIATAAEPSTTALVGAGREVITRCQTWLKTVTPNMLPANRRRLRARVHTAEWSALSEARSRRERPNDDPGPVLAISR